INIFEKNTPLHDGAVIIRGNRIAAATCYLPISDSRMDKTLGTRHRAGVGISEKGDSLTLIVSEENGSISIAYKGMLYRNVDEEIMRKWLTELQNKLEEEEEAAAEAAGEPLFRWSGFFRKGQTGAKNEDKTQDPE
ncbi:MAG: DNA integrity scanning protein DisA nucleotide-binding domain protein, partial [Lachnospiraceae bacterium]|nr:DNA integrity scanning protein DisA nucleotide-binding domain protein [Lachnospiraceae bacterium]